MHLQTSVDIPGISGIRMEMDQRIIVPMSAELVEAIDDYRFKNRLPSRSEAIRVLLIKSLKDKKNA